MLRSQRLGFHYLIIMLLSPIESLVVCPTLVKLTDGIVERFARVLVPDDGGLTLVCHPHCTDPARIYVLFSQFLRHLCHTLLDYLDYLHWVLLHPPLMRAVLLHRYLMRRYQPGSLSRKHLK